MLPQNHLAGEGKRGEEQGGVWNWEDKGKFPYRYLLYHFCIVFTF